MNRYFRDRIRSLLKLDDPPSRLALAFALGVFVAFSPIIGLHVVTCLALAWVFRLSKLVILTAAFVNNPWTIVPIYGFCTWFGIQITGGRSSSIPQIAWNEITFTNAVDVLQPYLWPFIAGTLVIGIIAAIISYFLFYWAVLRYRRKTPGSVLRPQD